MVPVGLALLLWSSNGQTGPAPHRPKAAPLLKHRSTPSMVTARSSLRTPCVRSRSTTSRQTRTTALESTPDTHRAPSFFLPAESGTWSAGAGAPETISSIRPRVAWVQPSPTPVKVVPAGCRRPGWGLGLRGGHPAVVFWCRWLGSPLFNNLGCVDPCPVHELGATPPT